MNLNTGGQEVVHRILEAYGFKTRQALCDRLGVSKSTMASRYTRDIFPADWVIQASIETGASLKWLSFGQGRKFENEDKNTLEISALHLVEGMPIEHESFIFDRKLIKADADTLKVVISADGSFLVDMSYSGLIEGLWLVEMDGLLDFREITRLPKQMLRVTNKITSFECNADDIRLMGKTIINLSSIS